MISFDTMRLFFALLSMACVLTVAGIVVLSVGARYSTGVAEIRDTVFESFRGYELWMAFALALGATLGSLYLSEIVHLVPCRLCWFQRIFMYPLVIVLGVAAKRRDGTVGLTTSLLAGIGLLIAGYHYLIQQVPSLDSGACDPAAPCSAAYIWQWNFLSIPFMAGSAFALILTLMFVLRTNAGRMSELEFAE